MRVLLVEDNPAFAQAVKPQLVRAGHIPTVVTHAADALARHHEADVVLLDLLLPDGHGLDVLRGVRVESTVPVLVVTAVAGNQTLVRALRLGADDYLVKPFGKDELLARIDAVVRRGRMRTLAQPTNVVVTRDVRIDLAERRVLVGGAEVELTRKEFTVLSVLAGHIGRLVTRQDLLDIGWGDSDQTRDRSLSVVMTTLRRKLNRPGLIVTQHGLGYRLEV
ncbi:response regulator transcription factor [Actinophytocola oryzae]|uniref:response regulator transcription factor n=1 Tax=Actinophytocola oryzae TaxID=502181 RepID=UPI001062BB60